VSTHANPNLLTSWQLKPAMTAVTGDGGSGNGEGRNAGAPRRKTCQPEEAAEAERGSQPPNGAAATLRHDVNLPERLDRAALPYKRFHSSSISRQLPSGTPWR
jgi:hypothetical protein